MRSLSCKGTRNKTLRTPIRGRYPLSVAIIGDLGIFEKRDICIWFGFSALLPMDHKTAQQRLPNLGPGGSSEKMSWMTVRVAGPMICHSDSVRETAFFTGDLDTQEFYMKVYVSDEQNCKNILTSHAKQKSLPEMQICKSDCLL